jgi:hypothetical protein
MTRITSQIKKAVKPVQVPGTENLKFARTTALPEPPPTEELPEVATPEFLHRKAQEYITLEVASSKGKKYKITVPASYAPNIPKVWTWNERRMKAAELIALGFPVSQVVEDPDVGIASRHIIYAWLQHPEFREHIDALVLETGFASQRERIAGLSRLTRKLFEKIVDNADLIPITDKSIGSLITGVLAGMKQLAQEKGEFVEQQHVEQNTNLSGTVTTASLDVSELLKSKTEEERKALEAEFDAMGNDIIRNLTGTKDVG